MIPLIALRLKLMAMRMLRADLARMNSNHDSHGRFGTGDGPSAKSRYLAHDTQGRPRVLTPLKAMQQTSPIPVPPGKASYPMEQDYKPSRSERVNPTSPTIGTPIGGPGLQAYREYERLAPFVAYHEQQITALQDQNAATKPYADSLRWGNQQGLPAIKAHMAALASQVRTGQAALLSDPQSRREMAHVYRTYTQHLTDSQMPLNRMSRNRMTAEQARMDRFAGGAAKSRTVGLSGDHKQAIADQIQATITKEAAWMAANRSQVADRLVALRSAFADLARQVA